MSIGFERAPAAEGGGHYTVFGLYEGDAVVKDKLIMKAEFGDRITGDPKNQVVTGLMRSNFRGLEDIDENELSVNPEAK
ncbi:hypothetical protein H2248_004429 [Termitomyces sp. 'cryptogamus']|nr:hypothetical protein H2248_004429 [Termitomyces sp. 'cryptogamus']